VIDGGSEIEISECGKCIANGGALPERPLRCPSVGATWELANAACGCDGISVCPRSGHKCAWQLPVRCKIRKNEPAKPWTQDRLV
jgi:hypothetical protein